MSPIDHDMSLATAAAPDAPLGRLKPYVVIVAVCAMALGLLVAGTTLRGPAGLPAHGASAPGHASAEHAAAAVGGHRMRTSFGSIDVSPPDLVPGPTSRALAGMAHGIAGRIASDRQLVQVPMTVHNDSSKPVQVDPGWFRIVGGADPVPPTSSSFTTARLLAGTSIDGTVGFVLPRDGRRLVLEFARPGSAAARVALGSSGVRGPSAADAAADGDHGAHDASPVPRR